MNDEHEYLHMRTLPSPFLLLQMSLADELLADLEEAGDEGVDGLYSEGEEGESDGEAAQGKTEGGLEDIPEEMETDYSKAESVAFIAKLRNSKQVSFISREFFLYELIFAILCLVCSSLHNLIVCPQFSEIMDKISIYIGKQRKNSEGECNPFIFYQHFYIASLQVHY